MFLFLHHLLETYYGIIALEPSTAFMESIGKGMKLQRHTDTCR